MTFYQKLIIKTLLRAPQNRLTRLKLLQKTYGDMDSFDLNRALTGFERYVKTEVIDKTVYYRLSDEYVTLQKYKSLFR